MKTCLQFLIIKVNEKSISAPQQHTTAVTTTAIDGSASCSPKSQVEIKDVDHLEEQALTSVVTTKQQNKRQKSHSHSKQKQQKQPQQNNHKQKHNQLASPPQDQVSSTQDQEVGPTQDEHDCQTSPLMLVSTQNDDTLLLQSDDDKQLDVSPPLSIRENRDEANSPAQTKSSPILNYSLTTATVTTHSNNNISPSQVENADGTTISSNTQTTACVSSLDRRTSTTTTTATKRKRLNNSDHDTSSTASWPSSYTSPHSPISTSSTSSLSSSSSTSSSSSCSSSLSPSPSPLSSPDIVNELRGPRLKLSEEKIRKIKKRPILFDDYYHMDNSYASTPTTSSGCSPGQHSNTTQNSDQSRLGISTDNLVIHMFQAPAKFVNNLKPCNLPTHQPQPPPPPSTKPPMQTKEMCAICGIKDRPPNISQKYGQNGCSLCTSYFEKFLISPQQLYCAQDGDCLMTFDSRCQACWIKICLQKFKIDDDRRKCCLKFSPKLLSSPNVSLITIDTSRQ